MEPDILTTVSEEILLGGRYDVPNPDVRWSPFRPFGKWVKWLVKTGVLTRRSGGDWLTWEHINLLVEWLHLINEPCGALVMMRSSRDPLGGKVGAVYVAPNALENAAQQAMFLAASTGSPAVLLVSVSNDMESAVEQIKQASKDVSCGPVRVVGAIVVGPEYWRLSRAGGPLRKVAYKDPSFTRSERIAGAFMRLQHDYIAKTFLARHPRWPGHAGDEFSPELVHGICRHLAYDDQESKIVICFDQDKKLVAIHESARGTRDSVKWDAIDILKVPILTGARYVVGVHNHPGGSLMQSSGDLESHQSLMGYSQCVGVEVLGDFIVSSNGIVEVEPPDDDGSAGDWRSRMRVLARAVRRQRGKKWKKRRAT